MSTLGFIERNTWMKKKQYFISAILIVLFLVGMHGISFAKTMHVQVKEAKVRKTPSFLGGIIAKVKYATPVQVVSEKSSWIEIATSKGKGWVHKSELSGEKIKMQTGDTSAATGADSDELALAGKGFSKEVEGSFKTGNPDMNYTAVNRMEKFDPGIQEIANFAREGGLSLEGGN